jgi:hypothetical protein
MANSAYHYTECGLDNIYLLNGYQMINTQRGQAISIKDVDGLHKVIGLFLVATKKNFTGEEMRFLTLDGNISIDLNQIADLEGMLQNKLIFLKHLPNGWQLDLK